MSFHTDETTERNENNSNPIRSIWEDLDKRILVS